MGYLTLENLCKIKNNLKWNPPQLKIAENVVYACPYALFIKF